MEDSWRGDNPFYLLIRHPQLSDGKIVQTVIDLDETDWEESNAEIIGLPGRWYLVNKADRGMPVTMVIEEGDKPYYKARHVGAAAAMPGGGREGDTISAEVIAYGVGKEMPDGNEDFLWHFYPSNVTCMGKDVNLIGSEVLKMTSAYQLVKQRAQEIAAAKAAQFDSTKPTPPPSGDSD